MEYYHQDTVLYLDGQFIKACEAKMDLYSQSLHYGYAVFEGIRSYKTKGGETKIFKAEDHFIRLRRSAEALNIPYSFGQNELIEATYRLLSENHLQDAYIRPLLYVPANMSFSLSTESHLAIEVWPMQPFLGEKLLRVMTSSFQRPNPKGFKIEAKATGHYVNSILASQEAKAAGYDEALLTDLNGYVAEGPGANVFFEKDGKLWTPPRGNILPGITRSTVLEICQTMGIGVEERFFRPQEVTGVQGAFFCGTAAEVIGWESLDGIPFAGLWNDSLGRVIQQAYKRRVVDDGIEPRTAEQEEQKKTIKTLSVSQ
jgi:branched-chain amino acid aminotransferase